MNDLKFAFRQLLRSPGFTWVAVLTLALGIGANTAVFSVIDAVLLRALPYPDPDRLVVLHQRGLKHERGPGFVAPLRLEDWNRMNGAFRAISGYFTQDSVDAAGPLPVRIRAAYVAPRFLQVLGVSPALGHDFTAEDEHFHGEAPGRVLISDRFWRSHFHAALDVLGKPLLPDRPSATIIGVMPAGFSFPERDVEMWYPVAPDAPYASNRRFTWYAGIGRLKPGTTEAQGRADLDLVQRQLARQFPDTDSDLAVTTQRLKDSTVGGARDSLWLLFGAVSVLLLIACTNVAALLLARGIERRHEFGIRFSLGASRTDVLAQIVAETFLLAVGGTVAGLGVAAVLTKTLTTLVKDIPRLGEVGPDWHVFVYTTLSTAVITLLSGLLPGLQARSSAIVGALSVGGRPPVSGSRPAQWVLVSMQVALAVVLLVGAGLLVRSFQALSHVSPGFEADGILVFRITGSYGETADMSKLVSGVNASLDALRSLPGVRAAAASLSPPGVPFRFPAELKSPDSGFDPAEKVTAESRWVSAGYFATTGIPILAGNPCDSYSEGKGALVNQSFASAYYGGTSPIGHHLVADPNPLGFPPALVQGLVGDARETGLDRDPTPTVYWCATPPDPGRYYLLRTAGDPAALSSAVRERMNSVEPSRAVYDLAPLTERLGDAYADVRLRTVLLSLFAAAALSLACIGLYGTLSYFVTTRRREIGLRMALGATRGRIGLGFMARGAAAAGVGIAVGLTLASAATRFISGMLYGVHTNDTAALSAAIGTMFAVALLASAVPAVRASRVDPMKMLREE
jgi:putative ABC transport system permease protein